MIIPDPDLRNAMTRRLYTLDYTPSMLGVEMIRAAYSPEGAAWVDAQMAHLDKNRRLMDDGLNAIPGIRSMPLQSTYLAWVDFTGTGMTHDEVIARIRDDAKIAVSPGPGFGAGGDGFQPGDLLGLQLAPGGLGGVPGHQLGAGGHEGQGEAVRPVRS